MYSEAQARAKLLILLNNSDDPEADQFEVSSIELSERKDYWIMYAKCSDPNKIYVGAGAYMLPVEGGEIHSLGSCQFAEDFLQDKYDIQDANGQAYILVCAHDPQDKAAILTLRQALKLSISQAVYFIRNQRQWFQGKKRYLQTIQSLLKEQGILSAIELTNSPSPIADIEQDISWWEELKDLFHTES